MIVALTVKVTEPPVGDIDFVHGDRRLHMLALIGGASGIREKKGIQFREDRPAQRHAFFADDLCHRVRTAHPYRIPLARVRADGLANLPVNSRPGLP